MASVDAVTFAGAALEKSPPYSEMSNFATYQHLQLPSGANEEEDEEEEKAQLKLDVEHSPYVSYGAAGLLAPPSPKARRKKAKRSSKSTSSASSAFTSLSEEVTVCVMHLRYLQTKTSFCTGSKG